MSLSNDGISDVGKKGTNQPQNQTQTEEEDAVVEEDWNAAQTGSNGVAEHLDGTVCNSGYATYDRTTVHLSADDNDPSAILKLDCVEHLTPMDVMNLYNGVEDATGNLLWMGANLFIESFCTNRRLGPRINGEHSMKDTERFKWLQQLKLQLFHGKKIIELGCGTGASGLALLKYEHHQQQRKEKEEKTDNLEEEIPLFCLDSITLTDSDPSSIQLCETNYKVNFSEVARNSADTSEVLNNDNDEMQRSPVLVQKCFIYHLPGWGEGFTSSQQHQVLPHSYNTVIATDVVYDIDVLTPLFHTASEMLDTHSTGYFVLSHVPRASVDGSLIGKSYELEEMICKEASISGFGDGDKPYATIRPKDLCDAYGKVEAFNSVSFAEMEDVGAAILIFEKVNR